MPEHRPTLDVVLTTPEFLTLKLDSRTRFEFRMAFVCSLYYMVQHDWDESGWEPINVYGLEIAYKF